MKLLSLVRIGLTIVLGVAASAAQSRPFDMWDSPRLLNTLKKGDFVGPLDHRHVLKTIGEIQAGRRHFTIVFYHYEQTWKEAVNFPHASTRLVVFLNEGRQVTYLEFYGLDDPPSRVEGHKILFPYPATLGNVIDFDEKGPPARVWLDGEYPVVFGK